MKSLQTNDRQSEKLALAFNSGDQITINITNFHSSMFIYVGNSNMMFLNNILGLKTGPSLALYVGPIMTLPNWQNKFISHYT